MLETLPHDAMLPGYAVLNTNTGGVCNGKDRTRPLRIFGSPVAIEVRDPHTQVCMVLRHLESADIPHSRVVCYPVD